MSVLSSAPGKILLFGEWGVLEGYTGVAMAVAPRLRIHWKESSHPHEESVLIVRGDSHVALWDPRKPIQDQKHIPSYLNKTIGMISSLMMRAPEARKEILKGGELRIDREWPLDHGLGSSSAIVACLLEIFVPQRERLDKWLMGREIIRDVQGGKASALDLAVQLRGSFVSLVDHKPKPILPIDIPEELIFLHAGSKADTSEWMKTQAPSTEHARALGQSAENFIKTKDWLGALREHALVLNETSLWPEELREFRKLAQTNNWAVEMKSCGAGGGDTWMIWSPPENRQELEEACRARSWTLVKYSTEAQGVQREVV